MAPPDAAAAPVSPARPPLVTGKRFLPLFLVQALGAFNDNVFKNAFVALLTFKLADEMGLTEQQIAALVAVAAAIFILPFALFAPMAGQIADRMDKATMMRRVKFTEIILMIAAAVAYHLESISFLYVLLFLMGAQSAFFSPIKYGVLPKYLPDDELVQGNGLVQAGSFLAILLGTIAGIQLIRTDEGVLLVSIAVIAVAVLGFIASLYAPPAPPAPQEKAHILPAYGLRFAPEDRPAWTAFAVFLGLGVALFATIYSALEPENFFYAARLPLALLGLLFGLALYALWPSIDASIASARERPQVFRTLLAIGWFWCVAAGFMTVIPVLVKETLNGDENVYTLLLAAFSIGVAIGASLVSRLQQGRIQVGVAPIGALGIAIFSLDIYLALGANGGLATAETRWVLGDWLLTDRERTLGEFLSSVQGWRVLFDFIAIAICAGLYVTPLNAIYQHRCPREAVGQVVAASNMIDSALMAFSSVLVIVLQSVLGFSLPAVLALLGVTGLITAVVVGRWSPETRFGRAVLAYLPLRSPTGDGG